MFEWIVMAFFIGVPVLLMVGALAAWIRQQREDFNIDDVEGPGKTVGGKSAA